MPLQFALEEIVPTKTTPKDNINRWNSDLVYHPVAQDIAETDDAGAFSIVNYYGKQVTPWILLNSEVAQKLQRSVDSAKNTGKPHQDFLGEELAIGDYVALSHMETAELNVGKVIAFTDKKIRVLRYTGYYELVLKNPSGLVKIQPNILSDQET